MRSNKTGSVYFSIDEEYILISHNKLKIKLLAGWIKMLNNCVMLSASTFVKKYNTEVRRSVDAT